MSGARHHTQLIVWQLADALRQATFTLTGRPVFTRDLKLNSQAEDAANSACRNIAEGFGADTHREFARFVRIARRSLNELQDALHAAQVKGYVSAADLQPARQLLRRIYPAISRFLAYLDRTPDERNDARRNDTRHHNERPPQPRRPPDAS